MNEAIINGISNKLFDVYGVQTANSDLQDDQGFINPFQRDGHLMPLQRYASIAMKIVASRRKETVFPIAMKVVA